MKQTLVYIFFLILLTGVSCDKDKKPENEKQELPPITSEGKNTFGCKINGEVWVAEVGFTIEGPVKINGSYNQENGRFSLKGTKRLKDENIYQYTRIQTETVFETGSYNTYFYNDGNSINRGFNDLESNYYGCHTYYFDTINPGTINILYFDTTNKIISGTFEMDLTNSECEDSILHITEGRFDWKYEF